MKKVSSSVRRRILPVGQSVPHGPGAALPERRQLHGQVIVERRAQLLVLVSAGLLGVAVRDPGGQRVRLGAVPAPGHLPAAHAPALHVRMRQRLPRRQVPGARSLRSDAVQERRPVHVAHWRLPVHVRIGIRRRQLQQGHRRVQHPALRARILRQHSRILQVIAFYSLCHVFSLGCAPLIGSVGCGKLPRIGLPNPSFQKNRVLQPYFRRFLARTTDGL